MSPNNKIREKAILGKLRTQSEGNLRVVSRTIGNMIHDSSTRAYRKGFQDGLDSPQSGEKKSKILPFQKKKIKKYAGRVLIV